MYILSTSTKPKAKDVIELSESVAVFGITHLMVPPINLKYVLIYKTFTKLTWEHGILSTLNVNLQATASYFQLR